VVTEDWRQWNYNPAKEIMQTLGFIPFEETKKNLPDKPTEPKPVNNDSNAANNNNTIIAPSKPNTPPPDKNSSSSAVTEMVSLTPAPLEPSPKPSESDSPKLPQEIVV
jgi:hypothetical protein